MTRNFPLHVMVKVDEGSKHNRTISSQPCLHLIQCDETVVQYIFVCISFVFKCTENVPKETVPS